LTAGGIALAGALASAFLFAADAAPPAPAATSIRIEDPALQALVDRLQPTLAANEKSLKGKTGPVAGFGAGATYPQIWLRDSATLLDLARFHFPRSHLASWIEEHLAHQQPDGSLYDWIAGGPPSSFVEWAPKVRVVHVAPGVRICADKNTVEADQESSAVIAAGRVLAYTGDAGWLRKDIGGRTVLQRCEDALAYLWRERRDAKKALVLSGFAADWGDVSPAYADQRVIYLDEETPRVVGLYTNALAYEAARTLAKMHEAAGDSETADRWWADAEWLKTATEMVLWQPGRRFYRMHAPAPGPKIVGDVADILGMGGHAAALRAGLFEGARAQVVLDTLEERRQEMKLPTASFSLLPPFPAGFFRHPAVKEPWTYQNGGQWDWFGGRLILAEFEHGRAERAREHLLEVARQARAAAGLYEWRTRDGEGRGSPQYAGSAGALGAAVIEGLLGVRLGPERLDVSPRLGALSAQVRLHEPATESQVEYDYRQSADEIAFTVAVSPRRTTQIAILLPAAWEEVEVQLAGVVLSSKMKRVGTDSYVSFQTDGSRYSLTVRPAARKH
jgi:hypothetical protein